MTGQLLTIIIKSLMQSNQDYGEVEKKRKYSKIPIKKRMLLVKMVLKKGVPLGEVVEELGLKITTARFIINKYKETGTFPRRKFKKRYVKPNKTQTCKQEFILEEEMSQSRNQKGENEEQVKGEQMEHCSVKAEENDNKMVLIYYPCFMM